MVIYRIEHPSDKYGPYRLTGIIRPVELLKLADKLCYKHNSSGCHPGIHSDTAFNFNCDTDICGFPSIESYKSWFYGFRAALRRNGYQLLEIEVPDKKIKKTVSGKQVAFPRKSAKVLRRLIPT